MRKSRISLGISYLNFCLFMSAVAFKSIVDAFIIKNDPNSSLNLVKYIILGLCILFYVYQVEFKLKHGINLIFGHEFKTLMSMCMGIFIITLYYITKNGEFYSRTVKEFAFLITPIIFVYLALNVFSLHELVLCAKVALIILGMGYIFQVGSSMFTPGNMIDTLTKMSFVGGNTAISNSVFESSAFSDSIMSLLFFFGYYRKKNNLWLWLSFLLVLLANKRLMMLFAIIIIIMAYVPKRLAIQNKVFGAWSWFLGAVIFCLMPYFVENLTTPATEAYVFQKFSINLPDFWMGRDGMVMNILNSSFVSHGLGSTFVFQGSLLEVEGVKFLLELGLIGTIIIAFSYWKITQGRFYCLVMMLYNFLNINTSTSIMTGTFSWIFYLILLGCCIYYSNLQTDISY